MKRTQLQMLTQDSRHTQPTRNADNRASRNTIAFPLVTHHESPRSVDAELRTFSATSWRELARKERTTDECR
jgi:hypothetical protein